jgi:transcription antitermination factor NusG
VIQTHFERNRIKISFALILNYMGDEFWWVIKTKSRSEKKLTSVLNENGWEAVCPSYTSIRQWSDRKKKVELPLITGSIFVKKAQGNINELYNYHQVISILRDQGKPALVRDIELKNLLILCDQWEEDLVQTEQYNSFELGDVVEVTTGKFMGMQGELIKNKGKHKVYLNIKSLQMTFSVVIPKSHVRILKKN